MVIHPNAGWAGVIWGRGEGGMGFGGVSRVAAGRVPQGTKAPPSVTRPNTIKKQNKIK